MEQNTPEPIREVRKGGKGKGKGLCTLLAVIVVVIVAAIIWQVLGPKPYSAVSLRTGDIYFGKLSKFPSLSLKDVYFLQVNAQNQDNPLSIQKLENVFWGPQNKIDLNKEQIIWTAQLDPNGQLAQLLSSNPDLIPQGSPSAQPAGTQTPPAGGPADGLTPPPASVTPAPGIGQ